MPYKTHDGQIYDSGEFDGHARRAPRRSPTGRASQARAPPPRRAASCAASAWRPMSRPAASGPETATVAAQRRRHASRVLIGTQIERAGPRHRLCPVRRRAPRPRPDAIRVVQGDTDQVADRRRHRRLALDPARRRVGRSAPRRSSPTRSSSIAADALEAAAGDLEIADGSVRVVGTDRAIIVRRARRAPPARTPLNRLRRRLHAARADLSRTAPTSPRSRSIPRPAHARSSTTSWSTISARR